MKLSPNKLSLAALGVTLAGGVSYFFLLDNPFIRKTALPNVILAIIGMALSVYAFARKRTKFTIPTGALSVVVGLFFIFSLYVLTKLPAPASAAHADTLPDFTLPNQDGRAVTLSSFRGKGPVLLVYYRGHW